MRFSTLVSSEIYSLFFNEIYFSERTLVTRLSSVSSVYIVSWLMSSEWYVRLIIRRFYLSTKLNFRNGCYQLSDLLNDEFKLIDSVFCNSTRVCYRHHAIKAITTLVITMLHVIIIEPFSSHECLNESTFRETIVGHRARNIMFSTKISSSFCSYIVGIGHMAHA